MSVQEVSPASTLLSSAVSVLRLIAPWMLLAAVLRTYGVMLYMQTPWIFFASNAVLFIAFLITAQRCIELTGGTVHYAGFGVGHALLISHGVIVRLTMLGTALHYAAWFMKLDSLYTTPLANGFDAIAFNRYNDFTLLWGPLIAILTYLMVVELAMNRKATFGATIRELVKHRRAFSSALAVLIVGLALLNAVQSFLMDAVSTPVPGTVQMVMPVPAVIFLMFVFGSIRLFATIAVLTYALRVSFRAQRT